MRPNRPTAPGSPLATAAVAAAVFVVAHDGGAYSVASRTTLALVVWWTILLGVLLGAWRLERIPRAAVAVGGLLAALAAWTLASAAWAASAEDAFAEFTRVALYLGVYVLAVAAAGRSVLGRVVDGLTLGIVAVGLVALTSRLFPDAVPERTLAGLPDAGARLGFPLDYWNGLGIFVALSVPLLLRSALVGGPARRATAVAALPALGAVVYLTSSRGAVLAAAAGALVLVLAQPRRWAALGLALGGAAGTAAAIGVLRLHPDLVDPPASARPDAWEAALLLVLVCAATAAAVEGAAALAPRLRPPARTTRRAAGAGLVAAAVAGVAIAIARGALDGFTEVPGPGDSVGGHLLSGGGSGRWQFWTAAVDEFRDAPLLGGGAGSFEAWWAAHGSFAYFVRDAHSLYLETLGELGLVGLALLAGALAGGAAAGAARLRAPGAPETTVAALLGSYAAFAVGAGIDWMWELTAVTVVGTCVLGLLTGPATLPDPPRRAHRAPARVERRRRVAVGAVALVACAVLASEAVALLSDLEVRRSQAAVRAGDLAEARVRARSASKLEPWAATPYLQLALVEEEAGRLRAAADAIGRAIDRDGEDWRAWLAASRIERRLGEIADASRSLARARSLNPRSTLVAAGHMQPGQP